MFIQTEITPNPATLKFLPGCEVLVPGAQRRGGGIGAIGGIEYLSVAQAERSALARRLFTVEGVARVFLGADFIAVTKTEKSRWEDLKPLLLMEIMEHYTLGGGAELVEEEGSAQRGEGREGESSRPADLDGPDGPIVAQILELLETRVRPAVARDGGDISFHGFENGIVYLKMRGACAGCPSSTATLKMGIENMLRHYVPEVTEVRPVRE